MHSKASHSMFDTLLSYPRKLRRKRNAEERKLAFDPVYYVRRYPDLAHFETAEIARDHFFRHGKEEGRFPNATIEEESHYARYLEQSADFDLAAYRALNPDLVKVFTSDRDFILHYIRHGRREGRPAVFSAVKDDKPLWLHLFSVSQFTAWASDWIGHVTSCDEAIEQFQSEGIERLAPIRFDHAFDPTFYRAHYAVPDEIGDTDLYRSWLEKGLPEGRAPSEARLLLPYIGEAAFPSCFDWLGYHQARSVGGVAARASALIHLFEQEQDWNDVKYFLRLDGGDIELILSIVRFKLRQARAREADVILRAWDIRRADWPAAFWFARGETHAAIGQLVPARDAYEHAIMRGETSLRAVIEAVRANLALGAFERAYNLLLRQRDGWLYKPDFERLIEELIERTFASASAKAHAALASIAVDEDEAAAIAQINDDMTGSLRLVERAIEELEVGPAHLGANPDGHVAMLSNEDLRQCKHYRVDQKQQHLEQAGFDIRRRPTAEADAFLEDLIGARAAIFYRLPATPPVIRAILTARFMGIPTYYDIDDLIFSDQHYPPAYETYQASITIAEYRGLQFGVPLFRYAMSLCDHAIASTPALLEYMLPVVRSGSGFVLRNALDTRNGPAIALGSRPFAVDRNRIRIFYGSGTLAHNADFSELVAPALAQIMEQNEKVDLVLVGHVPYDPYLRKHPDRVLRYPLIADIADYWSVLSSCDVNIAPLVPEPTTDCKSEIKWLEAAVMGIPTVASGTLTYHQVITSGRDGFVAETAAEWLDILSRLVADADMRRRIGHTARAKALEDYAPGCNAAILSERLALPEAPRRKRRRVLVCNVFFAPQSIGGATRVVEANVADIAANDPDIELAVFCTDDGIGASGRLRTSRFGDVPVFRVGVRPAPGMDYHAFTGECIDAFRRTLDLFDPEIVHFHCIQRLSGSIVRECLERGIPYVVTLHDAWWISSYQFLVDEDGLLRLPSSDLLEHFRENPALTATRLQRRRSLEALLFGATRVLAVSESFAEVYHAAGVSTVTALPNGVSQLPEPSPPDGHAGRLRLALIGGRSSHKGADLVEAALRLGGYENLHLLLIDGFLAPGEQIETRWGGTSVTISAPFPQGEIAKLYGGIDVLLAPSRWPESFGLVAREAGHFGLWVVAPTIGAMGEDIVEGQNGFRIDTTDRQELGSLLARMNAEPDKFRQGTALRIERQRTAHAQAVEIADLYRSIPSRTVANE
jgi:glycosyltransferase involved in cell wall biosynthesis